MLSCSSVLKGLSYLNNGDKSFALSSVSWTGPSLRDHLLKFYRCHMILAYTLTCAHTHTHTKLRQSDTKYKKCAKNYDDVRRVFKGLASMFHYCSFIDRKSSFIRITSRDKSVVSNCCHTYGRAGSGQSRSEPLSQPEHLQNSSTSARHSRSCSRAKMD